MPDNTNVNNSAAVTVVGRTAPVPPGQQKSDKSIPVVIASDQATIPVAEQNKVQSEVALSLLGIPRSEVALGIFADVNTYDVNPTEWASEPEQFGTYDAAGSYNLVGGIQGHGLSHIPLESGALIEAPADKTAVLTSKRFFRYQPGRVSAATFGVKTTTINDPGSKSNLDSTGDYGSNNQIYNGSAWVNKHNNIVANPTVRKYGIFDKYDGYYWETRNNGKGDNFGVVRRTQSIQYENKVDFGIAGNQQSQDYGRINPTDPKGARGSESLGSDRLVVTGNTTSDPTSEGSFAESEILPPGGFERTKPFGDLCVLRDNLLMVHGGVYDTSLLQPEYKSTISVTNSSTFTLNDIAVKFTNAVYDETTGLMVVTTEGSHGFHDGQYLTLSGIAMTCRYSYGTDYSTTQLNAAFDDGTKKLYSGGTAIDESAHGTIAGDNEKLIDKYVKLYPNNNKEYNIVEVNSPTSFTINVGVSTVPTFYAGGLTYRPYNADGTITAANATTSPGWAIPLSVGQHVSYSKGSNTNAIGGLVDTQIFRVKTLSDTQLNTNGSVSVTLSTFDGTTELVEADLANVTDGNTWTNHTLITPVPFIQPLKGTQVYKYASAANNIQAVVSEYGKNAVHTGISSATNQGTGTFPLLYKDPADSTKEEGYIDTTLDLTQSSASATFVKQVNQLNKYYHKWVNQNVAKDYWNVYEYRIPRSRFSGDRLDGLTDTLLYSDAVGTYRPGDKVLNTTTGAVEEDTSIWNLEFDKVTMYKIEFSWYGAVGALFLAYVPVSNGEARWVRVHHLRASNQLKVASLGNATLPITYMVYGGGNQDRFGYLNDKRLKLSDYTSASQHIVKYGASYYIDGGDRGTVKLFSHSTDDAINVFGSKRNLTVGSDAGKITITNTATSGYTNLDGPHITYIPNSGDTGIATSYYVGAKVITDNSLDQNIRIVYTDADTKKCYLNAPLQAVPANGTTISIIADRPTPIIGLKCRDFIQSSLGQDVRNRTQVYPTRMSTGSDKVVKVDFLKSPLFQTESKVTRSGAANDAAPTIGASVNIGKRGKPTAVSIPEVIYAGEHTFDTSSGTNAITVYAYNGTTVLATKTVTAATYTGTDAGTYNVGGTLVLTIGANHGYTQYSGSGGHRIKIAQETLGFKCTLDATAASPQGVSTKYYPRTTDPAYDQYLEIKSADQSAGTITVKVGQASAEYIRDPGTGVYGWMRGYYKNSSPKLPISVLGYLENRGLKRQQNISSGSYYFSALNASSDDIVITSANDPLVTGLPFLAERNTTPKAEGVPYYSDNSFTLADLSSVKINPELRSPIPGSGTVVSSIFAPGSGENYDLSPFFDYNKEYLSFPLTNKVESLYMVGSSESVYSSGTAHAAVSASLTWEEQ